MHNRIAALGRYGDLHHPNAAVRYNDALGLPCSLHHAQGCTLYSLCAGGRWIERKPDIFYSEFREVSRDTRTLVYCTYSAAANEGAGR